MPSHEMRGPAPDRPVVRILPSNAPRGLGNLYRVGYVAFDKLCRVPAKPMSHRDDRVATIDRPMILVTPMGRLYRTWYDTVGCFRVEVAA